MDILGKLIIILYGLKCAAAEITDIRFNSTTPGIEKGVILLKFNDVWVTICHHGEPNTWGKRESIVACRQLGFKGGWPTENVERVDQLEHLNNFDCDGTEEEMNDCGYEIPDQCLESKVAGVHCYDYFEIEISGSETPNLGRVEVRYDDIWSNVCYDSRESETRQWNIYNAQVVCKELRYPGTMFARRGGVGQGNRTSAVDGFKCREDLRDESLQDCLPDYPVRSEQSGGYACDHELTAKDNYAVVICAVPGYVGCFTSNADTNQTSITKLELTNMTIIICRNHCRNLNYTYAYLYKGYTCFCEDTNANELAGDRECRQECSGNDWEACGGRATVSIYEVNSGICPNFWNTSGVFYFGHTLSSHDLCGPGWKPIGASVLQCVLGGSPGEVVWNDTLPTCEYISGGHDNEGPKYGFDIKVLIIVSCAVVVLVLLIIICFVLSVVLRKRKLRKRKLKNEIDETKQLQGNDVGSIKYVKQPKLFVDMSDTNILSSGLDKLKSALGFNTTDEGEAQIVVLEAGVNSATKAKKPSKSNKLKFDETYFSAEDRTTEKHQTKPSFTGPCKEKADSGKKVKQVFGRETKSTNEEFNDRKLRGNQTEDSTSSNTSDPPEMYQNKDVTDRVKEVVMETIGQFVGQGDKGSKDKPTEEVINPDETQTSVGGKKLSTG